MITAGLTETTVQAMLHHAAAGMIAGGVRFSVDDSIPRDDLEEVLADELRGARKPLSWLIENRSRRHL